MTRPDIAIVGGGLLGRCLAWRASRLGIRVALYDSGTNLGEQSAAWVAAGMIAPITEALDSDEQIVSMGNRSLELWPQWLAELPASVFYRDCGTVLLWHRNDAQEGARAQKIFVSRSFRSSVKRLDSSDVADLEPQIGMRFPQALYVPGEAWVDNRGFLSAVGLAIEDLRVECHWETRITDGHLPEAGMVVDCRGMGAKLAMSVLRGVRGEIVRLHAPGIELTHMIRLLHPRYPVYIAPRPEGNLVVGATSIESDDRSPASVRGVLELLTAAHSLLPALAEARIIEFNSQVRPAFPDNMPALRFDCEKKVLRVNGLYRHGFLLTPVVVEEVLALLLGQSSKRWRCLDQNGSPLSGALSGEMQACSLS